MIFWNKIVIKERSIAYANIANTESLAYLYMPFMVLLKVNLAILVPYSNMVFGIISILYMFLYPIVTMKFARISQLGCTFLIGSVLISSIHEILGLEVTSAGEIILYFISIFLLSFTLNQFITNRLHKKLINSASTKNSTSFFRDG